MTATQQSTTQQIIVRRDRYMTLNYPRYPVAMVRGEGSRLWDADGKEYLDLFAGFGAGLLGHCHPDQVAAVTEQANRLWHVGNLFHTEPQTRLAEAIARHGFGGRSFFCHSGADANEAAIKLTRLYGRTHPGPAGARYKVITAQRSFHGRSFGTMVATAQPKVREGFEPGLDDTFAHVPFDDLDAVRSAIDERTVAVMVEPIQGEGGVRLPDDGYLPGLRTLCDQHDLLLICDEVWTGCGRTGRWFAHQHWLPPSSPAPDIMTLAKGVGGGLAVGVMCAAEQCAELYDHAKAGGVKHATTLGGNCLSMAVSASIFHVLERDGLVQRAADLGEHAMARLRRFAGSHDVVVQVRGRGLFIGVELNLPDGRNATSIVNACMDRGVLINSTQANVLRIAPALTIDTGELDEGLDVVEDVLAGVA